MSSVIPNYSQDVAPHLQGPPGFRHYLAKDGDALYIIHTYPYKKLAAGQQFRLLKLFPKSYVDPEAPLFGQPSLASSRFLYGSLSVHSLTDNISYECLSYVWGTAQPTSLLWLDTYMVAINANLDLALRCLQHKTEPRMLWVDFVCINQDDHEERKQQVELMYNLYHQAEKVIAYLGDEADGSADVPYFLGRISEAHFKDIEEQDRPDPFFNQPWEEDDFVRLGFPEVDDEAWISLRKFISRQWFVRVWIMQEALAAKELFVLCGLWISPASVLFRHLGIALFRSRNLFLARWEFPSITSSPVQRGITHFQLLLELGLCEIAFYKDQSWSLVDILERGRHASCTDPRDHVFALLNISNDKPSLDLWPDYTATVSETYQLTARALVTEGQGHRLLRNVWMSESELELPSWVPDWSLKSVPFVTIPFLASRYRGNDSLIFNAGRNAHSIRLGEMPEELMVSVFDLGSVHFLAEVLEYQEDPPIAPIFEDDDGEEEEMPATEAFPIPNAPYILKLSRRGNIFSAKRRDGTGETVSDAGLILDDEEWSKCPILFRLFGILGSYLAMSSSPIYNSIDKVEILWRTMICDRELRKYCKAPPEYRLSFDSYVKTIRIEYGMERGIRYVQKLEEQILSSPIADQIQSREQFYDIARATEAARRKLARDFENAAMKFGHSMRATLTDSELVGMVPRYTQKGDVAVVVRGVDVPLVLRRVGEGRFKVVGQAYFWGFMNGEVFEMDDMEEKEIVLV